MKIGKILRLISGTFIILSLAVVGIGFFIFVNIAMVQSAISNGFCLPHFGLVVVDACAVYVIGHLID